MSKLKLKTRESGRLSFQGILYVAVVVIILPCRRRKSSQAEFDK